MIATTILENQRLIILRSLAEQNDGRMNETMIGRDLDVFGYRLSKDEVRDQLRWLEARNALTITFAGETIMVAEITRRGQDHVDRRGDPLDGVSLPSRRS